jgi:hypothetical protein
VSEPEVLDIWTRSDRRELRRHPVDAGRLSFAPGDQGGGEFPADESMADLCAELFGRMEEEFDCTIVDLSAGRSYASDLSLAVTSRPELIGATARWLVFHRWTRQHIIAASGLVFGDHGILDIGAARGHDRAELEDALRFVRTAVLDPESDQLATLRPTQAAWLQNCNRDLQEIAAKRGVGRSVMISSVPLDPVLQWREQLITDNDVWTSQVANAETLEAFDGLARRLTDDGAWRGL